MAVTDTTVTITSDGLTTATTAYASGDCLDNVHTASGFASANAGTGVITAVTMVDKADVVGPCDLYVFTATISLTDNSAFAPSDAELLTLVPGGKIPLSAAEDLGGGRVLTWNGYVPFKCGGSTTALFFALVTRMGHTFFGAASDIQLVFGVTQTS